MKISDPKFFAEQMYAAFQEAVQQRLEIMSSGWILLSGGLDSRLLAGAIHPDYHYRALIETAITLSENDESEKISLNDSC